MPARGVPSVPAAPRCAARRLAACAVLARRRSAAGCLRSEAQHRHSQRGRMRRRGVLWRQRPPQQHQRRRWCRRACHSRPPRFRPESKQQTVHYGAAFRTAEGSRHDMNGVLGRAGAVDSSSPDLAEVPRRIERTAAVLWHPHEHRCGKVRKGCGKTSTLLPDLRGLGARALPRPIDSPSGIG